MPVLAALLVACLSGQIMAGWYVVRPGDTLWSISRATGVPVAELERINSITAGRIRPGQRLRVGEAAQRTETASSFSSTHVVRHGESLWSIARKYGLSLERIRAINSLKTDMLRSGQVLAVRETGSPDPPLRKTQGGHRARPVPESPAVALASQGGGRFSWPLRGRIVEKFGVKDKGIVNGITIAAGTSSDVRCAAPGEVAYADSLRGYGRMVIVRHEGGYHSIYAHLSKISVSKGQRIQGLTVVGQAGSIPGTGQAGVHFQLYSKGRAVDPLVHLRS